MGESPAFKSFESVAKKCLIMDVIESEGVEFDSFTETIGVSNPNGVLIKSFKLAKTAISADVMISLPKLKTHSLLQLTGAMKNLFGVIPGLVKSDFHLRFPDKDIFGQLMRFQKPSTFESRQ